MTELNIGQQLNSGRSAAGLTLEQLAEKLCLPPEKVALLEKNQFEDLSAPTYVAGYIRSYCEEVNLDVEPLLKAYQQCHLAAQPQLASTSNQPVQMDAKDPRFISMTIAVLLILFVLIGIWAWESFNVNDDKLVDESTLLPAIEAVFSDENVYWPLATGKDPDSNVVDGAQAGGPIVDDAVQETVREQSSAAEETVTASAEVAEEVLVESGVQQAQAIVVEDSDQAALTGDDTVIVTVSSQSWVNVRDANGYRLYYNMLNPSQGSLVMKGTAPFDIVLGDASAVNLSINDTVYNVRRHMSTDKSARFSVE